MKTDSRLLVVALICTFVAVPVSAAELGDDAPALKIKDWVKGEKVDISSGKGKNIYVVEFWATWCGPCRASIPHLTELQEKYKDKGVVFVGISDEETSKVEPFVKDWGSKMDYVVAVDDARKTTKAYMEAFGIRGIPHAFVVNKSGQIAWHGHPMVGLEETLDKVVAGNWDIEKAKEAEKERLEIAKARQEVFEGITKYLKMASEDDPPKKKLKKLGRKLHKKGKKDAMMMNMLAWEILTKVGVQHRDMDLAMDVATSAYEACDGKDAAIVDTYARALWDTGKKAKAIKYQRKAVELCKDENMLKELQKTLKEYEKKAPGEV